MADDAALAEARSRLQAMVAEHERRAKGRSIFASEARSGSSARGQALDAAMAEVQSQIKTLDRALQRTDAPDTELVAEQLRLRQRAEHTQEAIRERDATRAANAQMTGAFLRDRAAVQARAGRLFPSSGSEFVGPGMSARMRLCSGQSHTRFRAGGGADAPGGAGRDGRLVPHARVARRHAPATGWR